MIFKSFHTLTMPVTLYPVAPLRQFKRTHIEKMSIALEEKKKKKLRSVVQFLQLSSTLWYTLIDEVSLSSTVVKNGIRPNDWNTFGINDCDRSIKSTHTHTVHHHLWHSADIIMNSFILILHKIDSQMHCHVGRFDSIESNKNSCAHSMKML